MGAQPWKSGQVSGFFLPLVSAVSVRVTIGLSPSLKLYFTDCVSGYVLAWSHLITVLLYLPPVLFDKNHHHYSSTQTINSLSTQYSHSIEPLLNHY